MDLNVFEVPAPLAHPVLHISYRDSCIELTLKYHIVIVEVLFAVTIKTVARKERGHLRKVKISFD